MNWSAISTSTEALLAAHPETAFTAPILKLRLTGPLDADRLREAAEHTVREHLAVRRRLDATATGGEQPLVRLIRTADGSHTLCLSPAFGSVDTTGLLRAAAASPPATGPRPPGPAARTRRRSTPSSPACSPPRAPTPAASTGRPPGWTRRRRTWPASW
ncbi:hypothetical protein ABZY14_41195 [Streptomyces sp. NPDC006617]|uniref:hypothetical protein n=1 Tax=Streptomyces sp. NPDC006617 TaxID=3155354 RepID=UPI0033AF4F89